jgi:3-isopropylmalate/(R)-2-methylmalate dehydratase large subunit
MEARMTICNMSIEMGARGGLIAPDETPLTTSKAGRKLPSGEDGKNHLTYWKTLPSDPDAVFDKELLLTLLT